MKVQAIIFAMAIAAVSASPVAKQPAKEPVTDKSEPAVRANLEQGGRYLEQAAYDATREAKVTVEPATNFVGRGFSAIRNKSGELFYGAASNTLDLTGKVARGSGNVLKGTGEIIDRAIARPAYVASEWADDRIEAHRLAKEAEQARLEVDVAESEKRISEGALKAAQSAKDKAEEARRVAVEQAESAEKKAREMRDNARQHSEDAQKRADEAEQRANAKFDDVHRQENAVVENGKAKSSGLLSYFKETIRSGQKEVSGAGASLAQSAANKLSDVEQHAADKEHQHHEERVEAGIVAPQPAGALRNAAGAATAAAVAIFATASILL